MHNERLKELLDRFYTGNISKEEYAELDHWYHELNLTGADFDSWVREAGGSAAFAAEGYADLERRLAGKHRNRRHLWYRAAAAIVVVGLGAGAFFLTRHQAPQQLAGNQQDVRPGNQEAVLKTGGKVIPLGTARLGRLTAAVRKTADGQLTYNSNEETTMTYDTVMVPAGGRPYQVHFADGSAILLNAATTLRYPHTFTARSRPEVELISGEIYAAITHNPAAPLTIKTPRQTIADIGTTMDIAAYPDEAGAATILVEGRLKVNGQPLLPGQQALTSGKGTKVGAADLKPALAWVNGQFLFDRMPLRAALKQVARWYGVTVSYQGTAGEQTVTAIMNRQASLDHLLRTLSAGQVHYRIENKQLTILP